MRYTHGMRRPRLLRLPRLPRRISPVAARLFAVGALVFIASRIVAPVTLDVGTSALQVRAVPRLPGGHVVVPLGPLGEVSFATHTSPLDFEANILIDPETTTLPDADDIDVRSWRTTFIVAKLPWLVMFGALAILLAVHGPPRHLAIASGVGAVGTLIVAGAVAYAAVGTFDLGALSNPRYRGPVRDVPRILQLAREISRDFPGAQRNIARAVEGLGRLRADLLAGAPAPSGSTTRFLVAGDLQSNPLGLLIAGRLATEFDVDAILDAGDVTERGTAVEGEIFDAFSQISVPYVIVPGNHEDDAAIRRLSQIKGVTVLTDRSDTITLAGVTILGAEDPNARSIEVDPRNDLAIEKRPVICDHLVNRLAQTGAQILLVHDPLIGECAEKDAIERERPLLYIWGHTHRPGFKRTGSFVGLSPGTSGANGVKSDKEAPYGFALVDLDTATHEPVSVCLFAFDAPGELGRADCRLINDEP